MTSPSLTRELTVPGSGRVVSVALLRNQVFYGCSRETSANEARPTAARPLHRLPRCLRHAEAGRREHRMRHERCPPSRSAMWLSENRRPCRSTPPTIRRRPVQVSGQRCSSRSSGARGGSWRKAEGGAEEGKAAIVRHLSHEPRRRPRAPPSPVD
jgi:hypothetical protein